ncbi:hypothetical protein Tco_0376335, partial [Tanacetum coccineum]
MIGSQLMRLQLLQVELRLAKTPSRSFRPQKSDENSGRFGYHAHLGFHLLLIGLGA